MIRDVQETIIQDVQQSVRKIFETTMPIDIVDEVNQQLEVTILNAFWKHGISGSVIRTDKGENL
jgi:hypothetical protein